MKGTDQSEADPASSWADRERRVVTRLVVCRREGVERMVVRWAGVKSRSILSTTGGREIGGA